MFGRKDGEGKPELRSFPPVGKRNTDVKYPYASRTESVSSEVKTPTGFSLLDEEVQQKPVQGAPRISADSLNAIPAEEEEEITLLDTLAEVEEEVQEEQRVEAFTAPEPPVQLQQKSQEPQRKEEKMERLLTVGFETSLNGEISGCDRLVIEGTAKVTVSSVDVMEIDSTGSFNGTADVKEAHIKGKFDGDLIVSERLVIYETGKVCGNISYDSLEIKHGGELSGQINTLATASGSAHQQKHEEKKKSKSESEV